MMCKLLSPLEYSNNRIRLRPLLTVYSNKVLLEWVRIRIEDFLFDYSKLRTLLVPVVELELFIGIGLEF
jgi:hypothetical protein